MNLTYQQESAWSNYENAMNAAKKASSTSGYMEEIDGFSFYQRVEQAYFHGDIATADESNLGGYLEDVFFPDYQKGSGSQFLSEENRYELSDSEMVYLAEKFGDGNLNLENWDEFLFELQELGVISITERVTAGGFLVPCYDGVGSGESFTVTAYGNRYQDDPLQYLRMMKEQSWEIALEKQRKGLDFQQVVQDSYDYGNVLSVLEEILSQGSVDFQGTDEGQNGGNGANSEVNGRSVTGSAMHVATDPELDALKTQLNFMMVNNYSRVRFDEVSDREEEEIRWEKLLAYVDESIEHMKEGVEQRKEEIEQEEQYRLALGGMTGEFYQELTEKYDFENMSEEDYENFVNDLMEAGILRENDRSKLPTLGKLWEIFDEARARELSETPDEIFVDKSAWRPEMKLEEKRENAMAFYRMIDEMLTYTAS